MERTKTGSAVFRAVLAAALYALSTPVSKYLMDGQVGPKMMAALVIMALGVDLMSEHPVLFRKKD